MLNRRLGNVSNDNGVLLTEEQSSKSSAQSPPWRRNALPAATSASCSFRRSICMCQFIPCRGAPHLNSRDKRRKFAQASKDTVKVRLVLVDDILRDGLFAPRRRRPGGCGHFGWRGSGGWWRGELRWGAWRQVERRDRGSRLYESTRDAFMEETKRRCARRLERSRMAKRDGTVV